MPEFPCLSNQLQTLGSDSLTATAIGKSKARMDYPLITNALALFVEEVKGNMGSEWNFRKKLENLETVNGFNYGVIIALGELKSEVFLQHVSAGRSIDDVALKGSMHGRSTHRVQWMMIALYLGVKGKLNNDVIDLYKELGSAKCEARNFLKDLESGISFPLLLWDRLFDMVDISNGTCPEYFCGDFIKSEFPDLHKVMI